MKQQPWKRALSLMLAFALMFAMPCVTGVYAAGEPVDYIERWWDSRKQVVDSRADSVTVYTEIDPNTTTWNGGTTGGWYVVSGNVEITSRVTVTGDVHLILMDGSTLTVNGGIQVKDDDDNPDTPSADSLTIYGQEKGSGTVKAIGGAWASGIGGGSYESGGAVTIMGGIVEASGGEYAAGIGGGTTRIHGGTVIARSDNGGAGIGGGEGNGTFSTTAADDTPGTAVIYAAGGTNASAIADQSGKRTGAALFLRKMLLTANIPALFTAIRRCKRI